MREKCRECKWLNMREAALGGKRKCVNPYIRHVKAGEWKAMSAEACKRGFEPRRKNNEKHCADKG